MSVAKAKIRTQDTQRPDAERARQQAERQQAADKARVERARRAAEQANRTDPGVRSGSQAPQAASQAPQVPAQRAAARTIEERREIAKHAAHFESKYRDRVARINRLIGIYKAKGDDARVVQLERMREHLDVRRGNAMAGFRKQLGETGFKRLEGQINAPGRRDTDERAKPHEERRGERERTGGERTEKESPKEKPPGESGGGR
jgi:hypothetical protein